MKTSFKLFFLTLALAFVATSVNAQSEERPRAQLQDRSERAERTPEQIAERQTKRMTEALDLTPAQQEKIMAVNLEHAKQMAEIRESAKEQRKEMREKGKEIRKSQDKDLKEILTPEQAAKFEAKKAEMKDKHKERKGERGGRRGGRRGQ